VLGQVFWPQDGFVLALSLLLFITGIAVFTAAFGRLWCGWTCPQTVLMEMVFRRLEYWIEGDVAAQRALAAAPWTARKLGKKLLKHGLFFGLSFVIGNTLLAYIIGSDAWLALVTDNPLNHLTGLSFMLLFTLVFYLIFARFREQACTFICPYGRFQSTLIDENTIVVAYDHKRGERREHLRRGESFAARRQRGAGDCIDCRQCVAVCPTGIDIRNGLQMECVHCTACMDACDEIMTKVGRPRGLIRYASLNGIEKGERLRVTPRLVAYSILLLVLGGLLAAVLLTRSEVDVSLLRAPGALFQQTPEGRFSNLYLLKLVNKTTHDLPVELRLDEPPGRLVVAGAPLTVPAGQLRQSSVIVELDPEVARGRRDVVISVYSHDRRLGRVKTGFIGPRHDRTP
jgi:cytochrome c oxidase accessory protein FixG